MSSLAVSNLSNELLQTVNLQVQPGICLTISGPSGSGKSLLLRSIADIDPHVGMLSVDDLDSESVSGPEWRKQVALVPAESRWWYDTVGEHFSSTENIDFSVMGFTDEVLGWQIDRLSTGERQRLALLRALVLQPKVLLLDEPTAALDADSRLAVETLIQQYKTTHQAAVIWVSHDREQIERISDEHKIMDNGCLKSGKLNS